MRFILSLIYLKKLNLMLGEQMRGAASAFCMRLGGEGK